MPAPDNSSLVLERSPQTNSEVEPKPSDSRKRARFVPPVPLSLAQTGLPNSLIEQLILKLLYFRGDVKGGELCRAMGLKFSLIESMLDGFKFQQLIQVKSSLGYGMISSVLALTEQGRRVTRDYLD